MLYTAKATYNFTAKVINCSLCRYELSGAPYLLNTGKNELVQEPLALDDAVIRKISKRPFFQDIRNSFHGVTRMGLEPHQNFFQIFFSTNMAARGVQSFCILEGATDPLIEQ